MDKWGLIIIIIIFLPASSASMEFLFEGQSTIRRNLTIDHGQIQGISLTVTGSSYDGSLPSNITIDIGDDGSAEWGYHVYHSQDIANATEVLTAFSFTPEENQITIINATPHLDFIDVAALATLIENAVVRLASIPSGFLGLSSQGNLSANIISLTTPESTIHAFIPDIDHFIPYGFYIADGGSTYYCHSGHDSGFDAYCDMTPAEALVPANLARSADRPGFNMSEPLRSPSILETINTQLLGCDLPCNITIAITSETKGRINLSDPVIIPPANASAISVQETATDYIVTIDSTLPLTEISYCYGIMPRVYVIPFIKEDEPRNLTLHQISQLSSLNLSLPQAWDNLTDRTHPLNFTFYLTPVSIPGLISDATYADFVERRLTTLIPSLNLSNVSIVITLDIWDYFSNDANTVKLNAQDHIARIYANGFHNSSLRDIYRWDEEIINNVILHELAHVFITYPYPTEKKFHSDHPASFTDLTDFITYDAADSPAGIEGYYTPYSVLNQLRFFIASEHAQGPLSLSPLDQMLLGTRSPYAGGNYSFYTGNVTSYLGAYISTPMMLHSTEEAYPLFRAAPDRDFWDIRDTPTIPVLDPSFTVPKSGQGNRALLIFAKDAAHPDHFAAVNFNAGSISANATPLPAYIPPINQPPIITIISPPLSINQTSSVLLNCSATDDDLQNISIFGNWSMWHRNHTQSGSHASIRITLTDGGYLMGCQACDNQTCVMQNRSFTVYTPPPAPLVPVISPAEGSYHDGAITLQCSGNDLTNISLFGNWSGWHRNHTAQSNMTDITLTLPDGAYSWACQICDNVSCAYSANHTFKIDTIHPHIFLESPSEGATLTDSSTVTFIYAITEENPQNCSLMIHTRPVSNHSAVDGTNTISYALANGQYNWSVSCLDLAGNHNQSGQRILTLAYTPPPSPQPARGGGGGGGGGGQSTPPDENTRTKSYFFAPDSISWEIEDFDVISLTGTTIEKKQGASISITLIDSPAGLPDQETIKAAILINGTNIDLASPIIEFRIPSQAQGDLIVLSSFTDRWIDHETVLTMADDDYAYYRSEIPGWDNYYVREKKTVEARPIEIPEQPVKREERIDEPPEEPIAEEREEAIEERRPSFMLGIIIIVFLIAAALAAFLYLRKQ